jgi:hypothetical protein
LSRSSAARRRLGPLAARAQQATMPVVGFFRSTAAAGSAHLANAFRQGVNEAGFVENQNIAIEYRWADDQRDRLPELAADLVRRRVAAIVSCPVYTTIMSGYDFRKGQHENAPLECPIMGWSGRAPAAAKTQHGP